MDSDAYPMEAVEILGCMLLRPLAPTVTPRHLDALPHRSLTSIHRDGGVSPLCRLVADTSGTYIINDSGKYGFVTRTALSGLAGHRPVGAATRAHALGGASSASSPAESARLRH